MGWAGVGAARKSTRLPPAAPPAPENQWLNGAGGQAERVQQAGGKKVPAGEKVCPRRVGSNGAADCRLPGWIRCIGRMQKQKTSGGMPMLGGQPSQNLSGLPGGAAVLLAGRKHLAGCLPRLWQGSYSERPCRGI